MRLITLLCLVCSSALAQTTEMFRTVAADGTVIFSDVPIGNSSESISVLVRSNPTSSQQNNTDQEQEPSEAEAQQMAADCQRARDQLTSLQTQTRLYRVLPSGERQFLSDEEIAVARADAQSKVTDWCQ